MAPINEIVAGTALAAVRRGDDIRVYVTATNGDIREVRYHNGLWTGGTSVDCIVSGKVRSPLAATRCSLDVIHLFYVGSGNKLLEAYKKNNGWNNGSLGNLDAVLHPNSSLSAVRVGRAGEIRVYGQLPNCMIQEWQCRFYLCVLIDRVSSASA